MTRPTFTLTWFGRRPISTYETEACALAMAERKLAAESALCPRDGIAIHIHRNGRLIKVVARCRDHERRERRLRA